MADIPARVTYTGNGSTTDYVFPFAYLDSAHVMASVGGLPTAITLPTANTARFASAPAAGAPVVIYRHTDSEPEVEFSDNPGSRRAEALNRAVKQALYVAAEGRAVVEGITNVDGVIAAAEVAVQAALDAQEAAAEAIAAAAAAGGAVPAHTHAISDVTGLQTALDGKQGAAANLTSWAAITPSTKQDAAANLTSWAALAPSAKQDVMTVASQAEAEAGTNATHWMTPERTAQAIAALGSGAVRTWSAPSRAKGTTYYNTTGHEIVVAIKFTGGATFKISGVTQVISSVPIPSGDTYGYVEKVVPAGASYSLDMSGLVVIYGWMELR